MQSRVVHFIGKQSDVESTSPPLFIGRSRDLRTKENVEALTQGLTMVAYTFTGDPWRANRETGHIPPAAPQKEGSFFSQVV